MVIIKEINEEDYKKRVIELSELYRSLGNFNYYYVKNKVLIDEVYKYIHLNIPLKGNVLDLGCGIGIVANLLSFFSKKRDITGIDWDKKRIAIAKKTCGTRNINYEVSSILDFKYQHNYDAVLLIDVLHYLRDDEQQKVLIDAARHLNKGGVILIRDGDRKYPIRHFFTFIEEKIATLFSFTKGARVNFIDSDYIINLLKKYNIESLISPMWGKTPFSNIMLKGVKN